MVEGVAVDLAHLDGSAVLMVRGEIDVASAPLFRAAMEEVMSQGVPVVLDFAGVTFMDSSGLKVLLLAQTSGPADFVRLRNPPAQVCRLLAITGLANVICTEASPVSDVIEPDIDATFDNSRVRPTP